MAFCLFVCLFRFCFVFCLFVLLTKTCQPTNKQTKGSCGDISNTYESVVTNILSTNKFRDAKEPLSKPGCWAYPDMLEVGNLPTFNQDRAHFGMWAVSSSPLILSHNINNESKNEEIWPIIGNRAAISINQDWAGHPGTMVNAGRKDERDRQIWVKRLSGNSLAVFVSNASNKAITVAENLAAFGFDNFDTYEVKDVWNGLAKVEGYFKGNQFIAVLAAHDSVFFRLDKKSNEFDSTTEQLATAEF